MIKKPKGYRGGDAARSDAASGRNAGRADPSGGVDRSAVGPGSQYQKNIKVTTPSPNKDVPFKKPVPFGVPYGFIPNTIAFFNYKGRQKKAKKSGLYRDFYRTENKPLQPNSPIGKGYLREAGFGRVPKTTERDSNDSGSSIPPIVPITATKKIDTDLINPKENFFNFKAYNVGGLSGGVRSGPPPKRGPNSQVPPIKLKRGSKK